MGIEEMRCDPPQEKSATPLPKSKHLGDWPNERVLPIGDWEIRIAYAGSPSLAPSANPKQPSIPIKGSVTHITSQQRFFPFFVDGDLPAW
jgi:hypothetical protein